MFKYTQLLQVFRRHFELKIKASLLLIYKEQKLP